MATLKPKGRSFDQTKSMVRSALQAKYPTANYVSIDDIHQDTVMFSVETANANPRSASYAASYSIDGDGTVTLGEVNAVVSGKTYETVATFSIESPEFEASDFSATDTTSEIVKPCLIFRCGKYPEKNLPEYTQSDADFHLIPAINNGGLRLEDLHPRIDPKTGEIVPNRWTGKLGKGGLNAWRVGDDIYANVSFSRIMAEAFKGEKPSLSISINPITKMPRELSLVDIGHIEGAGVLAAFSASEETPKPVRKGAGMSTFKEKFAKLLGITEAEVETGVSEFSGADTTALEARLKQVESENAALKQGQSTFSAVTAATQAAAIADSLIRGGTATSAEREGLVSQFTQTLTADNGANFNATTGAVEYGPVTTAVLARESARPQLKLVTPDSTFSILEPNRTAEPEVIDSQAIYASRKAGAGK